MKEQKVENCKKEWKENTRHPKHYNKNKECHWWAIQWTGQNQGKNQWAWKHLKRKFQK